MREQMLVLIFKKHSQSGAKIESSKYCKYVISIVGHNIEI